MRILTEMKALHGLVSFLPFPAHEEAHPSSRRPASHSLSLFPFGSRPRVKPSDAHAVRGPGARGPFHQRLLLGFP